MFNQIISKYNIKDLYNFIVNLNSSPQILDASIILNSHFRFPYTIRWVVGWSLLGTPSLHPLLCPHIALFGLTIGP